MFSSRISFRAIVVSWILGALLFLVPASVLAAGAGTNFP